ncbi:hypothetical protein [Nonomuraea longicatena]|uniref:Integral membrane protein n=1 Tax=Nonomuraea longicatena TaxID=83682 RepID=A0ABP4AB64_9ACTN
MSSGTSVTVKRAGWILLALAGVHLALLALATATHLPGWIGGQLWVTPQGLSDFAELSPSAGAFWAFWGSFAVPLGLLGAMVIRSAREGRTPPAYVGIGLIVWAAVGALIFEPSPFVLGAIPGAMLVVAARSRQAVAA